jgi:GNAT superfamily N-acetyltransferase
MTQRGTWSAVTDGPQRRFATARSSFERPGRGWQKTVQHIKVATVSKTTPAVLHAENGIQYSVTTPAHRAAVVRLLGESFRREPMSAALQLTAAQLGSLAESFMPECVSNGLSVVAIPDDEPGTIAGTLICRDFKGPLPEGVPDAFPWFLPIAEALMTVDREYERQRPGLAAGEALDLWMAGVDSDRFARQGIARRLIELATRLARERGFTRCVAECTGHDSQTAIQQVGYTEAARLPYRDFRFENQPVFSTIVPPHTHLILYEKLL